MGVKQLKERFNTARERLATTQSNEEKLFLIDYINNLYEALQNMREATDLKNDALRDFDNYILYSRKTNLNQKKNISQFLSQKEFHQV